MPSRRLPLAVAATALLLAPLLPATPAAAQSAPITWEACPDTVDIPRARCGHIEVPMDYAQPTGATITVGFTVVAATAAAKDTVFVNPGGPGGDAMIYAGGASIPWPEEFSRDYTRVGVQPRGLAGSTPLHCGGASTANAKEFREACDNTQPGYLETISTSTTVRDWEEVRKALALEKISLMGASYGTVLAATYATEYSQHTNRVVLDSGLDTSLAWSEYILAQGAGEVAATHAFFAWVAENNATYGLGATPYQVYRHWAEAIHRETGALPPTTPPARTPADLPPHSTALGQGLVNILNAVEPARVDIAAALTQQQVGKVASSSPLFFLTRQSLTKPEFWDDIARGVTDPTALAEPAATFARESSQAPEDGDKASNIERVFSAVTCNENHSPVRPELTPALMWQLLVRDPARSGGLVHITGGSCSAPPVARIPAPTGTNLAVRPLQLQHTVDRLTPYQNSLNLQAQMNTHLVTIHGPGHSAFGTGNAAVDQVVLDYLGGAALTVTDLPGYFG